MKNINRRDLYIGKVVNTGLIYDINANKQGEPVDLGVHGIKFYRNMLFTPDVNKFSNDVLFDSPHYPILNMSDNEHLLSMNEGICLIDVQNLSEVLAYLNFRSELSLEDIKRIRKLFKRYDYLKPDGSITPTLYEVSGDFQDELPEEIYDVFASYGDSELEFWQKDLFVPSKQEGRIRKLK